MLTNEQGRTIFLGDVCLHTWGSVANTQRPALVLLHGFMQTGASWQAVAEQFAQEHYVVAPDLIGHGQSAKPSGQEAYTLDAYALQVAAVVQHLKAQRFRPVLVGYSFGGRVAAHLLTHSEGLLAGVVLESAGLGPETEEARQRFTQRSMRQMQRLHDDTLEAFVNYWEQLPLFETQQQLPEETRAAIRAERLANDPRALAFCLHKAGQHTMEDLRPALSEAGRNTPLLYIAGAKDVTYTEIVQQLQREQAISTFVIAGAGHNTHLEQTAAFVEKLRRFLEEL